MPERGAKKRKLSSGAGIKSLARVKRRRFCCTGGGEKFSIFVRALSQSSRRPEYKNRQTDRQTDRQTALTQRTRTAHTAHTARE